jgi:hypothetical protein
MRRLPKVLAFGLIILAAGNTAWSETELNISGRVRVRHETDHKQFTWKEKFNDFSLLRANVKVAAVIDSNTHIVVQPQISLKFGEDLYHAPNCFYIHQAYIQIDRLWADGWGLKAGRFELNLGNERVFGTNDWDNQGRVWDGLQTWYDMTDLKFSAFCLTVEEYENYDNYSDYNIFGLSGNIKNSGLEVFTIYESDGRKYILPEPKRRMDRVSTGIYLKRWHGAFDIEANAVVQLGSFVGSYNRQRNYYDINSRLYTLEIGYSPTSRVPGRVALAVDYAHGGIGFESLTWYSYNNLYYSGHEFRGHMDYFFDSNVQGLVDFAIRGRAEPCQQWSLYCDVHHFWKSYRADGQETSRLGGEFDLSVATVSVPGVELEAGASMFFPTETFAARANPDPGWWTYLMATANF